MGKGRLEAFTDGVLAIAITIMVLELKVPHETDLARRSGEPPAAVCLSPELRQCRHLLGEPPSHDARH
jgi:Endosomal/lysosomal potassium channel TMEM175